MPAKKDKSKKTTAKKSADNLAKLYKKVDRLAQDVDRLQIDVRSIARECLKLGEHANPEYISLINRIRKRLGL